MTCSHCGHGWDTPAVEPTGVFRCPGCGTRVCSCGCGESLAACRADSRYIVRAHREALRRRDWGSSDEARSNISQTGVGSRGGNVRSIEEARDLQEAFKQEWTDRIRLHMARTLLATGHLHADDLEPLQIPAAHANTRGGQFGSFASRGLMEFTGVERKVAHAAANARKGKIFRITEKGRRELPKMLVGTGATEGKQGEGSAGNSITGATAHDEPAPSTGRSASSRATPSGAPTSAGADPGEADQLFAVPDEKQSTSPYSAEAA